MHQFKLNETFKKKCLKFLTTLISTKSLSNGEKSAAKLVAGEMKKLGYDSVAIDECHNVVGKIGNGKTKLLYDAHTDTVGVGDENLWKTDPFKAVIKNGKVYGRGASDDKGCVAAMLYAGALLKKQEQPGDFTLLVSASAKEEIGGREWLRFIVKDLKFKPDFVVIGEPSALKIIYGHKGRAEFKINVKGKAVHASIPQEGENAIYKSIPIIEKIKKLNLSLKTGKLGKGVITVTKIETNSPSINSIPESCSFYIDRRTIEGENKKYVVKQIKKLLDKNGKIEYGKYYTPWLMDKKSQLLIAAQKTFIESFGKKPKMVVWPFCTNGSFTMGDKKIPTIGFGPGSEKQAHTANESIEISELFDAIKFYSYLPPVLCDRNS